MPDPPPLESQPHYFRTDRYTAASNDNIVSPSNFRNREDRVSRCSCSIENGCTHTNCSVHAFPDSTLSASWRTTVASTRHSAIPFIRSDPDPLVLQEPQPVPRHSEAESVSQHIERLPLEDLSSVARLLSTYRPRPQQKEEKKSRTSQWIRDSRRPESCSTFDQHSEKLWGVGIEAVPHPSERPSLSQPGSEHDTLQYYLPQPNDGTLEDQENNTATTSLERSILTNESNCVSDSSHTPLLSHVDQPGVVSQDAWKLFSEQQYGPGMLQHLSAFSLQDDHNDQSDRSTSSSQSTPFPVPSSTLFGLAMAITSSSEQVTQDDTIQQIQSYFEPDTTELYPAYHSTRDNQEMPPPSMLNRRRGSIPSIYSKHESFSHKERVSKYNLYAGFREDVEVKDELDPVQIELERNQWVQDFTESINEISTTDEESDEDVDSIIRSYLARHTGQMSSTDKMKHRRSLEKKIARTIFRSPSDWQNEVKINRFLAESRKLFQYDTGYA